MTLCQEIELKEVELKFLFEPSSLEKIMGVDIIQKALRNGQRQALESTYFDTKNFYLGRHGASLRIRKADEKRIQTIKYAGGDSLDRGEWEAEIHADLPDLSLIDAPSLARLLAKPNLQKKLRKTFEVNVERRSGLAEIEGAQIEIAIDQGQVVAGNRTSEVYELELELKAGEKAALLDFARALIGEAPLHLSLISKAEHGTRLLVGLWGLPEKSKPTKLSEAMNSGEAFTTLCLSCLRGFKLNELAFQSHDRIEGVHYARVSFRRLRSLFSLFKPMLEPQSSLHLQVELKWISGLLGDARDLDVAIAETFAPAAEDPTFSGAKDLVAYVETKRNKAHALMLEAIHSQRFRQFLVDLIGFVEQHPFQGKASQYAQKPVLKFAQSRLKKKRKGLIRLGKDLLDLDAESRHKFRIEAKKLRYMAEFFMDMPGLKTNAKSYRGFMKGLDEVQTNLGHLHDQEAKAEFLQNELANFPVAQEKMMAFAAGELAGEHEESSIWLNKALAGYKKLDRCKPF